MSLCWKWDHPDKTHSCNFSGSAGEAFTMAYEIIFGGLASKFQGINAFGPSCYQPRDLVYTLLNTSIEVFQCPFSIAD